MKLCIKVTLHVLENVSKSIKIHFEIIILSTYCASNSVTLQFAWYTSSIFFNFSSLASCINVSVFIGDWSYVGRRNVSVLTGNACSYVGNLGSHSKS